MVREFRAPNCPTKNKYSYHPTNVVLKPTPHNTAHTLHHPPPHNTIPPSILQSASILQLSLKYILILFYICALLKIHLTSPMQQSVIQMIQQVRSISPVHDHLVSGSSKVGNIKYQPLINK